jgi:HEAT repeat protein
MKSLLLAFTFFSQALHAEDSALARMLDEKLNASQRNDACYALRGAGSPKPVAAFARGLQNSAVRACSALNLREAGAVAELKNAFDSSDPEIRAVAARELGELARPEFLEPLARAARDPNLMVATNAFEGLASYQDRNVLPYLLNLAESSGLVAAMALSRAVQFADPSVLAMSRRVLASRDVPLRLAALRAIGDLGDVSDLPALRELAATAESAAPAGRGFGLVPLLDLSRAALNAIREIESRT